VAKDPTSRSRADARLLATFGRNLKSARENVRISQRQLATRAGLSQAAISQMESGQVAPTIIVLYRLAGALEIEVAELQRGLSG
jgi:HTH-type transcriptional regulator / antitoxin HipB